MAELRDILAFLMKDYPVPADLANARVTKLVYLTDWKHALSHGSQVSNIDWIFDNFGPFVWDVKETVDRNKDVFFSRVERTSLGSTKTRFGLQAGAKIEPKLKETHREAMQFVVKTTAGLSFDRFIKLVYSTYPVVVNPRYAHLDLVASAEEYKATF